MLLLFSERLEVRLIRGEIAASSKREPAHADDPGFAASGHHWRQLTNAHADYL